MTQQIKKVRCGKLGCKKKKMLDLIECKCGKFFCISHLLPEKHDCQFCHKNNKNLEKVVRDKIDNRI